MTVDSSRVVRELDDPITVIRPDDPDLMDLVRRIKESLAGVDDGDS